MSTIITSTLKGKIGAFLKRGRQVTNGMDRNAVQFFVACAAASVSIVIAPGTIGVLGAGLALVMVAIAAIDIRSYIIPDRLNAAGLGLALLYAAARDPDAMHMSVALAAMRGVLLALAFLALRQIYTQIRGRHGLGLGDVKLAAVAGAWLDWSTLPIAVEIATITALSVYLLRQYALGSPISGQYRMPFGFYFAPAIWLCWVLQTLWWDTI
jgi:leader peptidase (prepilin peptidase)/N-methyltransferase